MSDTDTIQQNPLSGALYWERKSKLRGSTAAIEFAPTLENYKDRDYAAHEVKVNGHHAGFVLYDPEEEKHFYLEPIVNKHGEQTGLKKRGSKGKLMDSTLSLLEARFPEEFIQAVGE